MKLKSTLWIAVAIFSVTASVPGTLLGNPAPKIKVGVGESVITPPNPIGVPMMGFDRAGKTSTGIHDDLYSRSLVVQGDDGTSVAMITVALVNTAEAVMNQIRAGVEKQTGIPSKNIVISSTHTHSGPGLSDSSYVRFFVDRTVESAVKAWKTRVPGKIGVGSTNIFGLAMNDRRLQYGGMTSDPEAAIIKVENASGKLMGVFFNYACHGTVLDLHNLLFTEDWPYYSIKGIKEKAGKDVVVGFFQSAEGDAKVGLQAELSAVGAYMYGIRTFEYAEQKGNIMTEAVLKLLPSIKTSDDMIVRAAYDKFNIPRRTTFPYTYEESVKWLERAKQTLAEKEKLVLLYPTNAEEHAKLRVMARELAAQGKMSTKIGPRELDKYKVDVWLANQAVTQSKRIEAQGKNPPPFSMSMQAIRLGNSVFVTFPVEVFTEIGVAVKEASPFANTFIFGLAGGYGGYIATSAEYLEGGYAVNGSPYAPETEQVIIDASLNLISRVGGDVKK
jgi:neutral ceramidase